MSDDSSTYRMECRLNGGVVSKCWFDRVRHMNQIARNLLATAVKNGHEIQTLRLIITKLRYKCPGRPIVWRLEAEGELPRFFMVPLPIREPQRNGDTQTGE